MHYKVALSITMEPPPQYKEPWKLSFIKLIQGPLYSGYPYSATIPKIKGHGFSNNLIWDSTGVLLYGVGLSGLYWKFHY